MFFHFNARKVQQIINQPAHAITLFGHDAKEALLRGGVIGGGAAQGFNKAKQARERRAQFMAGIGDKIGARPLNGRFTAAINQQNQQPPAISQRRIKRHDAGRDLARYRHGQMEFGGDGMAFGQSIIHGGSQHRMAEQRRRIRPLPGRFRPQHGPRCRVRAQHGAFGGKQQNGLRQVFQNGGIGPAQPFQKRALFREAARQAANPIGQIIG